MSALVQARYSAFSECLANAMIGENDAEVMFATGIDIGANRNSIVRCALDNEFDWVWFVDDDMTFPSDHLFNLRAHGQPVVASLYLNRKQPHYPMAFNESTLVDGVRQWRPVSLSGAPDQGLAEVVAAGTGGMLVRHEVFRSIEYDTWFDHHQSTDDLAFCQRVIEAGFPIYLDLAAVMGHISTYEVWPMFQRQQGWSADVRLSNDYSYKVRLGD